MKVKRENINPNSTKNFEFDVTATEFVVKNLTNSNIIACLGDFDEDNGVKIPAMTSEIISDNFCEIYVGYSARTYNKVSVKTDVGGEVEVRCLK